MRPLAALIPTAFGVLLAARTDRVHATRSTASALPKRGYDAAVACEVGFAQAGHASWDGGASTEYSLHRVLFDVADTVSVARGVGSLRVVYSAL